MSTIPNDLRYTSSHEWLKDESDDICVLGITDHAQELLGDVVFVELPEVGTRITAGEEIGVVESVKAASDIYAPLSGEVVAVNQALEEAPEQVNADPYGEGWFLKLRPADAGELGDLLDAEGYAAACDSEE